MVLDVDVLENVGLEGRELAHERAVAGASPLRRLVVRGLASQLEQHLAYLFVLAAHREQHGYDVILPAHHEGREQHGLFLAEVVGERFGERRESFGDLAQLWLTIAVYARNFCSERLQERHHAMQILVVRCDSLDDHVARGQLTRIVRSASRLPARDGALELADHGLEIETEVSARLGQRSLTLAAVVDSIAREDRRAFGVIEDKRGNRCGWVEHGCGGCITRAGTEHADVPCMLLQIGRRDAETDVIDLLYECHGRIRRFMNLAMTLGDAPATSAAETSSVAGQIRRYFRVALPLHLADEDTLIVPRLRGREARVDEALTTMQADHEVHASFVNRLVAVCTVLEREPRRLPSVATALAERAVMLSQVLEPHLLLEESIIFPALRGLPRRDREDLYRAMRRLREHAP